MKSPKTVQTTFSSYSVKESIGEGGCATVYRSVDDSGKNVAIKILDPLRATKEKLRRFENEYRFCARSTHKNIVTMLDHGITEDGIPFLVMPLYESSQRKLIGTVSPEESYSIFHSIMDGVEASHLKNVIHRDLKPENILVRNKGTELVIADYGIAHFEEEDLYTAVDTNDRDRMANFVYAAPEQKVRGATVDTRSDIFALGLIANELFTAKVPQGTDYRTIGEESPKHAFLDPLVEMMLRQDPGSRPNSVDAIKRQIIARSVELVARQELDRLRSTVITVTDTDDPLIETPVQVAGVDWNRDTLTIRLTQEINPDWVWSLLNMGGWTALQGKDPQNFQFGGKEAWISCRAEQAEAVLKHFRDWLPKANAVYSQRIVARRAQEEEKKREELKRQAREAEVRANVLKKLNAL